MPFPRTEIPIGLKNCKTNKRRVNILEIRLVWKTFFLPKISALRSNSWLLLVTMLFDQSDILNRMSTILLCITLNWNHLHFPVFISFRQGLISENNIQTCSKNNESLTWWMEQATYELCSFQKYLCKIHWHLHRIFVSVAWVALLGLKVAVSEGINRANRQLCWSIKNKPTMWSGQSQLVLGWRVLFTDGIVFKWQHITMIVNNLTQMF